MMSKASEMDILSRFRVYRIISYLKSNLFDFDFDTHDLEERGARDVISEYGVTVNSENEEKLLYDELYKLSLDNQISEIVRSMT